MMSEVFQTENQSYIITGSGTAAMEAAMGNILKKGDKVLNIVGGKFGQRFMQIPETHRGIPLELEVEWGYGVDPEDVKYILEEEEDIKAVTVVPTKPPPGLPIPLMNWGT